MSADRIAWRNAPLARESLAEHYKRTPKLNKLIIATKKLLKES